MRYRIDGFELDSDARTLTGPDGPVHVEPQVFAVLAHLVVNRDRAVPKAELLDEIWGDQFGAIARRDASTGIAPCVPPSSGRMTSSTTTNDASSARSPCSRPGSRSRRSTG